MQFFYCPALPCTALIFKARWIDTQHRTPDPIIKFIFANRCHRIWNLDKYRFLLYSVFFRIFVSGHVSSPTSHHPLPFFHSLYFCPGSKAAPRPGGIGSAAAGQPGMEGEGMFSKILPGGAAEQAGKLGEGNANESAENRESALKIKLVVI